MVKVSKFYDKKPVLKDIYLSFFYGAKIGVLGLNGAGKSSLLRIIAGTDKEFNGEVVFSKGYSVGYLEQEPKLDETKTVQQIVEEGAQETVNLLKEFEEINAKFAEPMDEDAMAKLIERQGEVQEKLDAAVKAGCNRFDGALKGIGGCPMADDELVGNMNTELMIPYLEEKGLPLELDQDALQESLRIAGEIFV